MKKIIRLLLFSLPVFFISCSESKKEVEKSTDEIRWNRQRQLDTLNKNEGSNLSNKFNAITGWDSTIKFTYQIQEMADKYNRPISFIGSISDIKKKDSSFILTVYGKFGKKACFVEVLVPFNEFHNISRQLNNKYFLNKGCFIFKPTSITSSSMLSIDSEISDGETIEDATTYLTYDFHKVLIFFKGSILDFYLYKQLQDDDD